MKYFVSRSACIIRKILFPLIEAMEIGTNCQYYHTLQIKPIQITTDAGLAVWCHENVHAQCLFYHCRTQTSKQKKIEILSAKGKSYEIDARL